MQSKKEKFRSFNNRLMKKNYFSRKNVRKNVQIVREEGVRVNKKRILKLYV